MRLCTLHGVILLVDTWHVNNVNNYLSYGDYLSRNCGIHSKYLNQLKQSSLAKLFGMVFWKVITTSNITKNFSNIQPFKTHSAVGSITTKYLGLTKLLVLTTLLHSYYFYDCMYAVAYLGGMPLGHAPLWQIFSYISVAPLHGSIDDFTRSRILHCMYVFIFILCTYVLVTF